MRDAQAAVLETIRYARRHGTPELQRAMWRKGAMPPAPHDIGTIIDYYGVAIRTGHHCAMPAVAEFGLPATARASLGVYNIIEEFDVLVEALEGVREMFG